MESLVKSKLKYFKNKNFTFPFAVFPWAVWFLQFDNHRTELCIITLTWANVINMFHWLKVFVRQEQKNFTTFSAPSPYCTWFISGHTAEVVQVFIFFRHVRTSHARSVRYDDDDMKGHGLGMWCCQHVLLMQRSDVTAASQRLFSFRMKWIFISDDDWKMVRINSVGRKKLTIKKKDFQWFWGKFCEILAIMH